MILFKKSYAEQLLQLALALSLLRVNPDSYLGFGWQSQLALNNGDGIQLELQAAPVYDDFPYANRKAIIPIIEDLVQFDRYRHTNSYDIQTYLLNIQNEQNTNTTIQQPQSQNNETSSTIQEATIQTEHLTTVNFNEFDLFLNSEQFTDSASLLDLNLADLNDYDDRSRPYAGLPLKDEPPNIYGDSPFDFKEELASTSYTSDLGLSVNASSNSDRSNYTRTIDWSEFYDITPVKQEIKEEPELSIGDSLDEREQEHALNEENVVVKHDHTDSDEKNSTITFSTVELTQEVCS